MHQRFCDRHQGGNRQKSVTLCEAAGARVALSTHWEHGGEGALELADAVMDACNDKTEFKPLYSWDMPF